MQFLKVRNFEKYQHYKDRHPVWIKLYRDLWSDQKFSRMSEFDRYCLISLFMVASQNQNCIPLDEPWLKGELRTTKRLPISTLIDLGWLEWTEQNASALLEISEQNASKTLSTRADMRANQETETETDKDKEKKKPLAIASPVPPKYTVEFEVFWGQSTQRGSKLKASIQFKRFSGMEPAIQAGMTRWRASEQWQDETKQPHISTWLARRGWEEIVPNGNGKLHYSPDELEAAEKRHRELYQGKLR